MGLRLPVVSVGDCRYRCECGFSLSPVVVLFGKIQASWPLFMTQIFSRTYFNTIAQASTF